MKVIIHQPRVEVREYDLPLSPDASDATVLSMCNGVPGVKPIQVTVVDTGSPFVYLRGADEVAQAGQRLAEARAAEDYAMAEAKRIALEALAAGTMSERGVADALGVDRNTVRAWQGKTAGPVRVNV
jgi:hypothetical protein